MPYMTTERVAEVRQELKKEFPDFKFSITRRHHSGINIDILSAPFEMLRDSDKNYTGVNHYYIKEHYKGQNDQATEVLLRIYEIANNGNRIVSEDGDYGSIPAFYVDLGIGTWEKPFTVSEAKHTAAAPQIAPVAVPEGEVQIIEYSDKSIAVIGDTKRIKDTLKDLGGKFNFRLTCGAGWIFPKTKLDALTNALSA